MRVHDVTLTLRAGMPTWPGEDGPSFAPLRRIARGDAVNVSLLSLGNHTGTHVDPPLHFLEGGAGVDRLPVDALVGPCRVVAFDGPAHRSAARLERAAIPAGTERILFKTRNSARWHEPAAPFDPSYLALEASAAAWLVAHGIRLVGIDYLSIEPFDAEARGFPVHTTLLRAGLVVLEGLDLDAIAPGDYEICCGPLKIAGGDGAPARVFLIERE